MVVFVSRSPVRRVKKSLQSASKIHKHVTHEKEPGIMECKVKSFSVVIILVNLQGYFKQDATYTHFILLVHGQPQKKN